MADSVQELQIFPVTARNVTAHCCATCTCPDVEDANILQRKQSSSSESSVGTLLPTGSEHSAGSTLRHRSTPTAGSGRAVNGHLQVDVSDRLVEDEDDDDPFAADLVASNLEALYSGQYEKLRHAFEDWEKTFETFQKRREYKEAQRDAIRNEVYQVIGFYVLFQGVIFTAVAQASTLRCHNWWTSFLLSLLTSLVTIAVVLQKLSEFWALETTIASEKSSAKALKTRINKVKLTVGPRNFDFKKNAKDGKPKDLITPGFGAKLYRFAVLTVLLCFSAIFLVSSWSILCKSGNPPPQ